MGKGAAIIIGSGVAGLASAIRLALQGYKVTVYEGNTYPGGKLSAFQQDGYRFDAGPSLFTQPNNIELLFDLAGEKIEDYLTYQQVKDTCHYFFENGKTIQASADLDAFAIEMQQRFGENPQAIKKYLARAKTSYQRIGTIFLEHSLHKTATFLNKHIWKALLALRLPYLTKSLNGYNRSRFRSAEAVQIFNRYATYNGSNPYKAPAMLSMIPHLEMNEGTFYPAGGMVAITNALYALALKKGVQFHFGSPVENIIHQQQRAIGVTVNGGGFFADVVVSNCDVYFTYQNLLCDELAAKKILRQERSSSALIFYWGISKTFSQLGLHNILFGKDYALEFKKIFEEKTIGDDPTVYINITAKMETGQAPIGHENWFVMINVPANNNQDWDALKQLAKKNVIQKINRLLHTNIEQHIETEAMLDPVLMETNTRSYMGSLYGTSSNSRWAAFLRHPNFTKKIKNLYFVGGSVHPGGGIPLCLKSAKIMAEMVRKDVGRRKRH